ncbi:hypothetical protein [Gemmata sp. SH-PL17]|uniref:hypothetical protein n=1 Tax=Gemmata sp. SH-PL17 TaxID=1630693 RepID=UPI0009EEF03E|nr:hypothetical protein [Gemmata sp. SH-PL17]
MAHGVLARPGDRPGQRAARARGGPGRGAARAAGALVEVLADEAEQIPNGVPVVWHPDVGSDELRAATARPVLEVRAARADEALARWRRARDPRDERSTG